MRILEDEEGKEHHEIKHTTPPELIGKKVKGIRRTEAGFVKKGWWFFQREFPDKTNPYWYRKKRGDAKKAKEEGPVVEEYVGVELPFKLPKGLLTKPEYRRYKAGALVIKDHPTSHKIKD